MHIGCDTFPEFPEIRFKINKLKVVWLRWILLKITIGHWHEMEASNVVEYIGEGGTALVYKVPEVCITFITNWFSDTHLNTNEIQIDI